MEPGLPSAIMRTLAVRPWFVSSPAEDFPIYSIQQSQPDPTRSTIDARITVQTVREWKAGQAAAPHSHDSAFQLAVVSVDFREDDDLQTHSLASSNISDDSSALLNHVFHSFDIPEAVLACFEGGKF